MMAAIKSTSSVNDILNKTKLSSLVNAQGVSKTRSSITAEIQELLAEIEAEMDEEEMEEEEEYYEGSSGDSKSGGGSSSSSYDREFLSYMAFMESESSRWDNYM